MKPIVVSPPLKGEWNVLNTPGDKIPSHGTDKWGMTYAYDFFRLKKHNGSLTWHKKTLLQYLLAQVKLSDAFGWGEAIYSPINGVIREVISTIPERNRMHIASDFGLALFNSLFFSYEQGSPYQLCGNYIIIEGEDSCALLAHAKMNSIHHKVGEAVTAGEYIAEVGHSGNSTIPHLHFQLMDRVDIKSAKGLPCCFSKYEEAIGNVWQKVKCGIPASKNKIRF
jgi:hypothetical protein